MLSAIANNAFRTLGVTSEASLRVINVATGKMRALSTVGRKVEMPLDLNGWLPNAQHDAEALEAAKNTISLKHDRLKHALCWFVNATERDEEALKAVGDLEFSKAVSLWQKNPLPFSAHFNLATLFTLMLDPVGGIVEMELATDDEAAIKRWLEAVDCAEVATPDSLLTTYLGVVLPLMSEDAINELLHDSRVNKRLAQTIQLVVSNNIRDHIVEEVARCNPDKCMWHSEIRQAIGLLQDTTLARLAKLKSLWGEDSPDYQLLTDKVARTLSECAIRFHNDSSTDTDRREAMHIQAQAAEIAYSLILKQKIYKDIYDIEGFQFGEPPCLLSQHTAIENILNKTDEDTHFSNILKQLLRCALPLCQIYDILDRDNQSEEMALYFKHISSRIASHFGHMLLNELNRLCNLSGKRSFGPAADAWMIVTCLQKLHLSKAYRLFEFDNLINQIANNPVMKLDTANWTKDDEWSTAGLFDFSTEEEAFNNLHTVAQYDFFIKRFPYSRHTARIKEKKRQKQLEEQAALEADEKDWQEVKTARQAREYLIEHPRGVHADEARSLIEAQHEKRNRRLKPLKNIVKHAPFVLAGFGIFIGIAGIIFLIYYLIKAISFWGFIRGLGLIVFIGLIIVGKLDNGNDKSCGKGCIVLLILASLAGWIALGYSCAEDRREKEAEQELARQEANAMSEANALIAIEDANDFDFSKASDILEEYYGAEWSSSLEEKYDDMVHARLDSAGWRLAQVDSLYNELYYLHHTEYVDTLIQRQELISRFGQYCDESDEKAWRELKEHDTYDAFRYYILLFPEGRHVDEAEDKMREHTHLINKTIYTYRSVNGKTERIPISISKITHD